MSSVVIAGDTSGTVTLDAPAVAGTTVITLPATSGTVVVTATGTAGFPSGTRMSFQQTAAPTGWTKDTTAAINDSVLRLVTGSVTSGGSTAFSTWSAVTAVGATTLSTAQIPSHQHSYLGGGATNGTASSTTSNNISRTSGNTGAQGGGGSHDHSVTRNLKYYDFIIATAN